MYARKLESRNHCRGERRPCPLDMADGFAMRISRLDRVRRHATDRRGQLEAGFRVEPERWQGTSAWLTKPRKGNGQPVQVEIHPA